MPLKLERQFLFSRGLKRRGVAEPFASRDPARLTLGADVGRGAQAILHEFCASQGDKAQARRWSVSPVSASENGTAATSHC
jgi:hypothetical protein